MHSIAPLSPFPVHIYFTLLLFSHQAQAEVLVFSRVNGATPSDADLRKLSGHAYMSGADSWVDLERMIGE